MVSCSLTAARLVAILLSAAMHAATPLPMQNARPSYVFMPSAKPPTAACRYASYSLEEMWHFIRCRKHPMWLLKALCRDKRRVVAWVLGDRHTATVHRLLAKVSHLSTCWFSLNKWVAFAKILPACSASAWQAVHVVD